MIWRASLAAIAASPGGKFENRPLPARDRRRRRPFRIAASERRPGNETDSRGREGAIKALDLVPAGIDK
jgi:hypothetical protein